MKIRLKNIIRFSLALSLVNSVAGQDTIPFRVNDDHNIIIHGIVNNTDSLDLMVHTASNAFTVIDKPENQYKSIQFLYKDSIESWGGGNETLFSKNNSLKLGKNISLDSLRIWQNNYSGKETDGKIGLNLLADEVVEIDFGKKIIVCHDSISAGLVSDYSPFQVNYESDFIFLKGRMLNKNDTIPHLFLIHSGYSGGILLDDKFASESDMVKSIKLIKEQNLKDSYGNILKTYSGILEGLLLGPYSIEGISIAYFSGSIGKQKMSVMGTEVISKFNWIFDLKNNTIYLQKLN